jgi:two-component system, LuxR family, response regulator FixJ
MISDRTVFLVDDDAAVRESLCLLLEPAYAVRCFAAAEDFLAGHDDEGGCVIADMRMPGMSGLALQEEIVRAGIQLPVILITGHGDVPLAVRAMKAGAIDFIEKPFDGEVLVASIERALAVGRQLRDKAAETAAARRVLATLTARERDVLAQLVKGQPNKVVAFKLGISPRTVEIHRARIMTKMKSRSLSELVRVSLAAGETAPPAQAAAPVLAAAS